MDFSQLMRLGAGSVGGMGQGMMDQEMRRTYGTARAGGYADLMENDKIGDFVTGDNTHNLMKRFQDLRAKLGGAKRGMQTPNVNPMGQE